MASVTPDYNYHQHGDPRDDESILDDDLIEADECKPTAIFSGSPPIPELTFPQLPSKPMTPYTTPPTEPPYEATSNRVHRPPEVPISLATT